MGKNIKIQIIITFKKIREAFKREAFISKYRRNSLFFNQQIQIHHLHFHREGLKYFENTKLTSLRHTKFREMLNTYLHNKY